jgi:hypothetical protein
MADNQRPVVIDESDTRTLTPIRVCRWVYALHFFFSFLLHIFSGPGWRAFKVSWRHRTGEGGRSPHTRVILYPRAYACDGPDVLIWATMTLKRKKRQDCGSDFRDRSSHHLM